LNVSNIHIGDALKVYFKEHSSIGAVAVPLPKMHATHFCEAWKGAWSHGQRQCQDRLRSAHLAVGVKLYITAHLLTRGRQSLD